MMIIILSIIFIIIDQVSKLIVINTLSKTKSVEVIKSFFYLTYTNNNGAAFSILTGKRVILIIVTLIVIGILIYYIRKTKVKENIKNFWQDEDGMGVVEIVLIIVVLIGLVIIFKSQITALVNKLLSKMSSQANKI